MSKDKYIKWTTTVEMPKIIEDLSKYKKEHFFVIYNYAVSQEDFVVRKTFLGLKNLLNFYKDRGHGFHGRIEVFEKDDFYDAVGADVAMTETEPIYMVEV